MSLVVIDIIHKTTYTYAHALIFDKFIHTPCSICFSALP